ncbi:MAG: class II aldolase/adducin family protein [Alphaproteobacteria bacterium]
MSVALRRAIIRTARAMNARGINQGRSGNVSARWGRGFLITPTATDYDRLRPTDIVAMEFGGRWHGRRAPSSEWRFHHDILKTRPAAGAVVHAHAPYATTLSCLRRSIPAFHYMVAVAGGNSIRCARYATFGTAALSTSVLAALKGRKACLLANHGLVAVGEDLEDALRIAEEVETLAAQYWRALIIGRPTILSKGEMARIVKKFESYGRPATTRP